MVQDGVTMSLDPASLPALPLDEGTTRVVRSGSSVVVPPTQLRVPVVNMQAWPGVDARPSASAGAASAAGTLASLRRCAGGASPEGSLRCAGPGACQVEPGGGGGLPERTGEAAGQREFGTGGLGAHSAGILILLPLLQEAGGHRLSSASFPYGVQDPQ